MEEVVLEACGARVPIKVSSGQAAEIAVRHFLLMFGVI